MGTGRSSCLCPHGMQARSPLCRVCPAPSSPNGGIAIGRHFAEASAGRTWCSPCCWHRHSGSGTSRLTHRCRVLSNSRSVAGLMLGSLSSLSSPSPKRFAKTQEACKAVCNVWKDSVILTKAAVRLQRPQQACKEAPQLAKNPKAFQRSVETSKDSAWFPKIPRNLQKPPRTFKAPPETCKDPQKIAKIPKVLQRTQKTCKEPRKLAKTLHGFQRFHTACKDHRRL